MIRDWSDKVKEKDKNESHDSKFVWRVQGSQKTGCDSRGSLSRPKRQIATKSR